MAKIPYYVRHLRTNTIDATDSIVVDVLGSDVPKIVPFSAFSGTVVVDVTAEIEELKKDYSKNFLLGGM